jgi:proliferating cell nuclear antigen
MLAKLKDARILGDAVSVMSELVTEVKAKLTKNGLSVIAIDPANVALVMLKIPASSFMNLEAEDETLCVNLEDLKQVLRRLSSGPLLIERDENMLRLSSEDKKRSFSLALISLEQEEKKVPELEFSSRIEINSDIFSDAVNDALIVADACTFETNSKNEMFVIDAKGTLNNARTEFSGEEARMQLSDAKSKYSLQYLQKFIKASKFSEKTLVQFSKDYPMRLDFKSPELEMLFILAPRVETEE